jgi:hypothetical protein
VKNNNNHRVCSHSNTTGDAIRAGTAYPLAAAQFSQAVFRFLRSVLLISVGPFVPFLLAIALSILLFTASYYLIGIFKLFLIYELNTKTRM